MPDNKFKPSKPNIKPEEFVVSPVMSNYILLDQISRRMGKLLEIETSNQKYLSAILKELHDDADEGQELTQNGTASNTDFVFIDIGQLRQGQRARSFELSNDDSTNSLFFAWNTTRAGLQPSPDDTISALTKFRILEPGDSMKISFNRKVIENIAILGQGGNVSYRLWLIW